MRNHGRTAPSQGRRRLARQRACAVRLHGRETPEAALADAEAAIVEWFAAAKQLGREVPGPASLGQWRQRVPRSLHEKLKIVASREGVSPNAYVANVLAESVGRAG